jgi:hypothetical protein
MQPPTRGQLTPAGGGDVVDVVVVDVRVVDVVVDVVFVGVVVVRVVVVDVVVVCAGLTVNEPAKPLISTV